MADKIVVIAGATGDLGGRIVRELSKLKAPIRALVRQDTPASKVNSLKDSGCQIIAVDLSDHKKLVQAMKGASVILSALSGLREIIVEGQRNLLEAAVEARVARFIPSDFSIDFTKIAEGENRNLSFRLEFLKLAEQYNIRLTSILNGAFSELLTGVAPFILFRRERILCWGSPEQLMDWTTIDDTARFTAFAALDENTPRFLRIAGDEISANSLASIMTDLTGRRHKILKPGSLQILKLLIQVTRILVPGTKDLYPPWQGMQYMYNLYGGNAKFESLDNNRYPINWTKVQELLSEHLKKANIRDF